MKYRDRIIDAINAYLKAENLYTMTFNVSRPPQADFGNYSTNVALLVGKKQGSDPIAVAETFSEHLRKSGLDFIEKIEVAKPGFINFFLTETALKQAVLAATSAKYSLRYVEKSVFHVVEYSSPNIAKPFTIGHLRSTIIGDAIARMLVHAGHSIVRDNHLGDWGTQFGKMIVAIKKWGDEDALAVSSDPVKDLVTLYQKFCAKANENVSLEDEARAWFVKLERNDPEARRIWKKCIELSMTEFSRIYTRLDVTFDTYWGESHFEDAMKDVIDHLNTAHLLTESEGAQLVFFKDEDKLPPLMIIKKDGGTLYSTRDLATALVRRNHYGPDTVVINEVGKEQSQYFKQIFLLEEILGYFPRTQRHHVGHGLYRFAEGKMSTRKGNVIWLNDVLDTAVQNVTEKFNVTPEDAEIIGIGAIKFNDLSRSALKDIVFDWEKILNMQGDSGPYVQYTATRINSLLKKVSALGHDLADTSYIASNFLWSSSELALAQEINDFREVFQRAVEELAPHYIATQLLRICQEYNSYYVSTRIINNTKVHCVGVAVSVAVNNILELGLGLLGIKVPEKM